MENENPIYIPDFYARQDADELFEFIRAQPFVRPPNTMFGGGKSYIRRLSFPGYCPDPAEYRAGNAAMDAPPLYRKLSANLTGYAGRLVYYSSGIGYQVDDFMHAHHHDEDRRRGPGNQTVWVLSLGAVHPVRITSGETTDVKNPKTGHLTKKFVPDGGSETIYPRHGSLYILPSSFNEAGSGNEREHAVLPGDDHSYGGLRISVNTKHIPLGLSQKEFDIACSRPAGRTNAHSADLFVREPGPPQIFDCHRGKRYPSGAIYIGREVKSRQTGEVEWPSTPYGNHKKLNGQEWIDETARLMRDPEFAAEMRHDLHGKDLLCWCGPKEESRCHGRRWLELANS